jgi:hypothetical protein
VNRDELRTNEAGKEEFGELRETLRAPMPAIGQADLRRDLWPDMLQRLERLQVRVPWFDWALLAFAGASLILFPALIPALLYQL